jgi:FtsP/CotA-like multicopper oxidase with cupredoxin domain
MHSSCNAKLHLLEKREQQAEGDRLLDSLVQLDGLHRLVTAVNGIRWGSKRYKIVRALFSPGPTLVVPFGAEVLLRVRNRLHSQALSVHVHGLLKEGRWWTDGVPFLQQCPIAPGSDYSYRFIADTPGTHWYHGQRMALLVSLICK